MIPSYTRNYEKEAIHWFDDIYSRELFNQTYSDTTVLNTYIGGLPFRHKVVLTDHTKAGFTQLLLDLYVRYKVTKGEGTIGVFTSNGNLSGTTSRQYSKLGFIGKKLKALLEQLREARLIDVHQGKTRHSTKIRATPILIEEMDRFGFDLQKVGYKPFFPVVYTDSSTEKKERIDIAESIANGVGLTVLNKYNTLLRHADIKVGGIEPLYAFEKVGRRTFSTAEANLNGRFYGPIWQNMRQQTRLHITINGNRVSELDVKSTHPLIAYALCGHDLTEIKRTEGEAYQLSQLEVVSPKIKEYLKAALLRMINCSSLPLAANYLNRELRFNSEFSEIAEALKVNGISSKDVLQWLYKKHHRINKYLFANSVGVLNYYESNIAMRVIEHFTMQNILVLTVHDSFIVEGKHEQELKRVLIQAISDELKIVFKYPESLCDWKQQDTTYAIAHAYRDLLTTRINRDKQEKKRLQRIRDICTKQPSI